MNDATAAGDAAAPATSVGAGSAVAIAVSGLAKGYGADDRRVEVLRGLDLEVAAGEMLAVVGLSGDWFRPSYFAAKYLIEHGYTVIPVNPRYQEILGQKCYQFLAGDGGKASHPSSAVTNFQNCANGGNFWINVDGL